MPSGKGAGDENFPVGSWLLPKDLRPDVAVYYAFARTIDDIADHPDLPASDKIARLQGFAAAVNGGNTDPAYIKGQAVAAMFERKGIPKRHGLDLISAFIQDATKSRYANWAELIGYCDRSASPVGRFLLDLHGEDSALHPLSDALCNALQVINHLQDCGKDYAALDRVYLPTEWMAAEGATVADLALPELTAGMRRVVDRALAGTETLLAEARKLPKALKHRRLAAETAVIVSVADKLTHRLARRDPLAARVILGPVGFAGAALSGLARLWF
ncbi:MAG: squalene synthase HpnC [Proteobacteria bacterium]|nr:squalene synthase HpnC [Pseudomonadota bacterium]